MHCPHERYTQPGAAPPPPPPCQHREGLMDAEFEWGLAQRLIWEYYAKHLESALSSSAQSSSGEQRMDIDLWQDKGDFMSSSNLGDPLPERSGSVDHDQSVMRTKNQRKRERRKWSKALHKEALTNATLKRKQGKWYTKYLFLFHMLTVFTDDEPVEAPQKVTHSDTLTAATSARAGNICWEKVHFTNYPPAGCQFPSNLSQDGIPDALVIEELFLVIKMNWRHKLMALDCALAPKAWYREGISDATNDIHASRQKVELNCMHDLLTVYSTNAGMVLTQLPSQHLIMVDDQDFDNSLVNIMLDWSGYMEDLQDPAVESLRTDHSSSEAVKLSSSSTSDEKAEDMDVDAVDGTPDVENIGSKKIIEEDMEVDKHFVVYYVIHRVDTISTWTALLQCGLILGDLHVSQRTMTSIVFEHMWMALNEHLTQDDAWHLYEISTTMNRVQACIEGLTLIGKESSKELPVRWTHRGHQFCTANVLHDGFPDGFLQDELWLLNENTFHFKFLTLDHHLAAWCWTATNIEVVTRRKCLPPILACGSLRRLISWISTQSVRGSYGIHGRMSIVHQRILATDEKKLPICFNHQLIEHLQDENLQMFSHLSTSTAS
ncbi:hypothetical protein FISHEDRAFT_62300 [Fistulina hepatica ATCC 64428]|nr:hypothetical protein FISHEDRAFT_62300 [Fistulina hepatica ATCC 64428]